MHTAAHPDKPEPLPVAAMGEPSLQTRPLVTVVTANYNGGRYLKEAVASVLDQTYSDFEYIIVDDGSTDDSRALIEELSESDDRIVPVFLPDNVGVAQARNEGIRHMRGDLLTFIDADDRWHAEKLARQVEAIQSHPHAGVVVVGAKLIGADGQLLPRKKRKAGKIKSGRVSLLDYVSGHLPVSINTMTRRECIDRVGTFNPAHVIGEDYELWMRIIQQYEYYYIDEPLHYYRIHDTNATRYKLQNRRSKIQILEELVQDDEELKERLGNKFCTIMQRKYNSLGKIYCQRKQYEKAEDCFDRALTFNGSSLHRAKARFGRLFVRLMQSRH